MLRFAISWKYRGRKILNVLLPVAEANTQQIVEASGSESGLRRGTGCLFSDQGPEPVDVIMADAQDLS